MNRATIGTFSSTSRTKSHVLFHVDAKKSSSFAFNPLGLEETSNEIYKNILQASINDDFVFTEEAKYVEYLDLSKSLSKRTQIKSLNNENCKVSRPRESELFNADRDISETKLSLRCKDSFQILTATGDLIMKTNEISEANHGDLLRGFVAADS